MKFDTNIQSYASLGIENAFRAIPMALAGQNHVSTDAYNQLNADYSRLEVEKNHIKYVHLGSSFPDSLTRLVPSSEKVAHLERQLTQALEDAREWRYVMTNV